MLLEDESFPFRVGQDLQRTEIHAVLEGQEQQGISTPKNKKNILLFTNPVNGAKYGYDEHEGLRENGVFSYTGQGPLGDQEFNASNVAVRDSTANGIPLRLFLVGKTSVTYIGRFVTADSPYRIEKAPDQKRNDRMAIVFDLLPVDADTSALPPYGGIKRTISRVVEWKEPNSTQIERTELVGTSESSQPMSRIEFQLQAAFGRWVRDQGLTPTTLQLSVGNALLTPDLYVEPLGWVVEAKKSIGRAFVRMAIGQVLDYVHVAQAQNRKAIPVILLPGHPEPDLQVLITGLGIITIVQQGASFELIAAR
ncbi:hypothetical protein [Rathayibacter sp. VKM Ac-2926]|uniref:hypothetical protein n=1 Tax=Rathayibacter sp. VKM Ac-2926 TaxID=2929477 RepID=UPI001FB39E9F|nr:hypothetical protein [Rathayibacter sp. VKM Ac-2926]MCJ1702776.1 hypothetical protein [Rathayibacter sp. VKM Ac-2926]